MCDVLVLFFQRGLVIVGLVMILTPESYYRETQAWKQNKPSEPSRAYIIFTRICGGVALAAGIISIILLVVALFI